MNVCQGVFGLHYIKLKCKQDNTRVLLFCMTVYITSVTASCDLRCRGSGFAPLADSPFKRSNDGNVF